jgi:hypothetical protein
MTYKSMFKSRDFAFIEAEHARIKEFERMLLKYMFHPLLAIQIWENIQDMKELIKIIRGNYVDSGEGSTVKKLFTWN